MKYFFLTFFFLALAGTPILGQELPTGHNENIQSPFHTPMVKDNFVQIAPEPVSTWSKADWGLLIPGADMFLLDKPLWGVFYGSLKLAAFFMIYATYKDYRYWQALADSAYQVQKTDPLWLFFYDPRYPRSQEHKLSYRQIQNYADSGFLNIALALIFQAGVFTVNYLHSNALEQGKPSLAKTLPLKIHTSYNNALGELRHNATASFGF